MEGKENTAGDIELIPVSGNAEGIEESSFTDEVHEKKQQEQQTSCCKKAFRYKVFNPESVEPKSLTPKVVTDAFLSRASLCGYTEIHESGKGIKKKCWVFLVILCLVALFFHTYRLIYRFSQYPTNTGVTLRRNKFMDFPAVTICNNNMLAKNLHRSLIGPPTRSFDQAFDYLTTNDSSLGHQKEDFIVTAIFNSNEVEPSEFSLSPSSLYGNCYTFNSEGTRTVRRAIHGYYGLDVILNVESYKYSHFDDYNPVQWVGAIVKVHEPGAVAAVVERRVAVSPNTINTLGIKETRVSRLGKPHGLCRKADQDKSKLYRKGSYSKERCENTCLQKEVIERCCCYIKVLQHDLSDFPDTWDSCVKDNIISCHDSNKCWLEVWDEYDRGDIKCEECLPLCQEVVYEVTPVAAEWPTEEYIDILIKNLSSSQRLQADLKSPILRSSLSNDFVRKNLMRVQINFDSLITTYINETAAINPSEFVSEIGSALGLWVGWSAWTFFKVVEYFSDLIALAIRKKKREKAVEDVSQSGEVNQQEEELLKSSHAA